MSRIDEINTILDNLGGGATYSQVEYALRDYEQREVLEVLADRSLSETFNGGTITEPLEINVADNTEKPLLITTPDVVFQLDPAGGNYMELDIYGVGFSPYLVLAEQGQVSTVSLNLGGDGEAISRGGNFQAITSAGAHVAEVGQRGVVISRNTAPANGDLVAGQVALWFDKTDGAAKLKLKGKSANGTVVQGEVALA